MVRRTSFRTKAAGGEASATGFYRGTEMGPHSEYSLGKWDIAAGEQGEGVGGWKINERRYQG